MSGFTGAISSPQSASKNISHFIQVILVKFFLKARLMFQLFFGEKLEHLPSRLVFKKTGMLMVEIVRFLLPLYGDPYRLLGVGRGVFDIFILWLI
jgi:hypothetical protein